MRVYRWLDRFGMLASVGCGIHCATFSLVLIAHPALWLSRSFRNEAWFLWLFYAEWTLLVLAWLLAALTMAAAWLRTRCWQRPLLALGGLLLMTLALLSPRHGATPWVSAMAIAGGFCVACAHFLNLRRAPSMARPER